VSDFDWTKGLQENLKRMAKPARYPALVQAELLREEPKQVTVAFRAPYPPSANRLYRARVMGKTATIYKTKEHADYLGAMGNAVRVAGIRNPLINSFPLVGRVKLTGRLYRPRKVGDIDNPLKALFDSLNSLAWADDSQVRELHLYLEDDKHDPRIELELEGMARR
jgi:Holliday junction resolvase RusA-like endonuclease